MEPVLATIDRLYCILSSRAAWRVMMFMILITDDIVSRQRVVKSVIMITCTDL
jgi:hypothetical protein